MHRWSYWMKQHGERNLTLHWKNYQTGNHFHDDVIKWKHFHVTGPLCGEFTGPGEFPAQRPVTRSFDVFSDLRLNKRLSKQPWSWWFETPPWSLWRHCNVIAAGDIRQLADVISTVMATIRFKSHTMYTPDQHTHWGRDKMAAISQRPFFNCIFLNENIWISINISLKFVPKGRINNIPALVQIMAWCRLGDKPLSEPMVVELLTHICVTRPQWVNILTPGQAATILQTTFSN